MQHFHVFFRRSDDRIGHGTGSAEDEASAIDKYLTSREQTAVVAVVPRDFLTTLVRAFGNGKPDVPSLQLQPERKALLDKLIEAGFAWPRKAAPAQPKPATLAESTDPRDLAMMKRDGPAKVQVKQQANLKPVPVPVPTAKPALPALTRATDLDNISRHGSAYLLPCRG